MSSGVGEIAGVEVVEGPGSRATAGMAVVGTLYRQGDSIQLSATIADPGSGKTYYTVGPVEASVTHPGAAIETLVQRVVGGVAMLLDPSWGVPGVLPARPPTWDAFREFHQGDLSFYVDGVDSAFAHFSRAGARDPTFALARLRAAQVLINAGTRRWGPADSALTAVAADRTTMSPFERGYLDCIEAWHRGNWEGAYTATVTLTEIAPRSEFAGYLRGTFANLTRRWHKAVSVLERLDPLASDLRARSAYYGHLSNAHHMLGEHSRELATARLARERFPDQIRVRQVEVRALAALGSSKALDLRVSEALALPAGDGTRGSAGRLLLVEAREARAHGYPALADTAFAQLLNWLDTRPTNEDTSADTQRLRIDALRFTGKWDKARAVTDSQVTLHPNDPAYAGVLGVLAAQQGRREEADRIAAQLRGMRRPELYGEPTLWRARIAAQLGEKARAVALLRDAMAEGSRALASDDADPDLEPLRDFPGFRDLVAPRD